MEKEKQNKIPKETHTAKGRLLNGEGENEKGTGFDKDAL